MEAPKPLAEFPDVKPQAAFLVRQALTGILWLKWLLYASTTAFTGTYMLHPPLFARFAVRCTHHALMETSIVTKNTQLVAHA